MDVFSKRYLQRNLLRRERKPKVGKSQNNESLLHFSDGGGDGGKVGKPIVIWRSKKPRCLRLASASDKLAQVSYFDDSRCWM